MKWLHLHQKHAFTTSTMTVHFIQAQPTIHSWTWLMKFAGKWLVKISKSQKWKWISLSLCHYSKVFHQLNVPHPRPSMRIGNKFTVHFVCYCIICTSNPLEAGANGRSQPKQPSYQWQSEPQETLQLHQQEHWDTRKIAELPTPTLFASPGTNELAITTEQLNLIIEIITNKRRWRKEWEEKRASLARLGKDKERWKKKSHDKIEGWLK